eukprot:symbB.v1.2.007700.t1/scaffold468.1/size202162/14
MLLLLPSQVGKEPCKNAFCSSPGHEGSRWRSWKSPSQSEVQKQLFAEHFAKIKGVWADFIAWRKGAAVYNLVGSLYCDHAMQLYFPVRKREPYSLASFARSLADGFSRSASYYRISWPESITLFFMTESGVIKDWSPQMSGLVARLMEAGLQHLCLKNLQRLQELFQFYAKLTLDSREGRTMLTYMPPPVYLRMATTTYEQHPLFYIQVTVERNANTGESSFIPSLELSIEAAFASADTKTLDRALKFAEVVLQLAHRWKLDTSKMDLLPDGAAHGGAPTANNVAVLRNTAHMLSQMAQGFSTAIPDDALSSDDERPSVDELMMAPPTRRQDIKVLFQDASGQLEVKLTAHPSEFREVLVDHFRKVVELTEKYSTIDGSLQQDGEVKQQYLASLSSMQKVDHDAYQQQISGCFFDPWEVVYEVHQYQALLQRFSHQEEQLKKMLNIRFEEVAVDGVSNLPEGDTKDDEVQSQSAHSSFSEERRQHPEESKNPPKQMLIISRRGCRAHGSNWCREATRCFATEQVSQNSKGACSGRASSVPERTLALRLGVGLGALGLGAGSVAALAWWQLPRIQAVLHPQQEVVSFWQRWLGPQHPADRIFDGADLDRDGHLDRRELAQYMMSCGIMDMSGFNAIWEEINTKDSEAISREERSERSGMFWMVCICACQDTLVGFVEFVGTFRLWKK